MSASESRLKLDLSAPAKSDCVPKVSLVPPGGNDIVGVPEQYRTREDLEKALNESKHSEAHLREFIDTIPAMAWRSSADGAVEFLNQRWHDYTGLSPEEARGWGWQVTVHPEDLGMLTDTWQRILASGAPGEMEARLRRYDGEYRWFIFRVVPLHDERGNVVNWFETNTDIEDRKRAESLVFAEKRTLEMIAGGASLTAILENLCSSIDAQVSNSISTILLMDRDGKRLWPAAGPQVPSGWTRAITPLSIGPCVGSCGTAAFLKKLVITSDIASDPLWVDYRDVALGHGLRAAWSQPLISKTHEVLGTFAMYYAEPRSPSDSDLRLIEGAGHIALIAIEGERSQTALTKAHEEINRSEAKLRKIIDTMPTLAWCGLPDGSREFWNQRWHDYTGLSPEAARGWGWQAAIHPDDLGEITDKWLTCLTSGQPVEVEARLRRFDGQYRWFLLRAEPMRDESGQIVNWYGTNTDIENLKRAEEKLRQDERELRQIVDTIAQLVVLLSPEGDPLYANRFTLDYTGLSLEELKADGFRTRVFHPDDVERLREERQNALSRGVPFENEQRARRSDGQYRWFFIHYNALRDDQGRPIRWYAAGIDIDDQLPLSLAGEPCHHRLFLHVDPLLIRTLL